MWPPDPYLAFAQTRVVARAPDRLVLEGIDSPVTGVRLLKSFAFDPADPATLDVSALARNIRDRPVSRDLWFNTRTSAATRVYVPVATAADVRIEAAEAMAPAWRIDAGVFAFLPPSTAGASRRGKVLMQPSAGWMAGFAHRQAFVIRFDHQPRSAIHPQQGQVELYLDHDEDIAAGLLAGLPGSTPVAVVQHASLPHQREAFCTLGELARTVREQGMGSPAVMVVGDVMAGVAQLPTAREGADAAAATLIQRHAA